jgi:hypothetical protein
MQAKARSIWHRAEQHNEQRMTISKQLWTDLNTISTSQVSTPQLGDPNLLSYIDSLEWICTNPINELNLLRTDHLVDKLLAPRSNCLPLIYEDKTDDCSLELAHCPDFALMCNPLFLYLQAVVVEQSIVVCKLQLDTSQVTQQWSIACEELG